MLLAPFLPSQGLVLLVAKRGVGKTHIALGIAYAVATGGTFLKWAAPKAKKVLYIDGEMPAVLMQERLRMIVAMSDKKHAPQSLKLLTPDLQDHIMPDLSREEGRDELEPLLEGIDLVVLDNISCLFRSGSENESESWQEAQEWALSLRKRGMSVLFVHHAGKSGNQRGTSKREDILDSVIILKHADDYKPEEGARFEVIFDKARHFSGEDARSFQARLITEDDTSLWELSDAPQEEEIERIAIMKNNGDTIKQIAAATKLTKAQIEYRTAKAKEKGLIVKQ
jgi:putative DNA primase/helicase